MKAFLAGLGIGTLLGIVFAPASGEETRRTLTEAANQRFGDVREQISTARDQVNQYASRARETFDRSADCMLDIINEWPEQRLIEIHGIGPVLAEKIIKNRPYKEESDLIESKILPPSAIEALRKAS